MTLQEVMAQIEKVGLPSTTEAAFRLLIGALEEKSEPEKPKEK